MVGLAVLQTIDAASLVVVVPPSSPASRAGISDWGGRVCVAVQFHSVDPGLARSAPNDSSYGSSRTLQQQASSRNTSNTTTITTTTTTMLLMSDSRPLDQYGYHQLAYRINAEYARRHGYRIRFVHTPCMANIPNTTATSRMNDPEDLATKQCIACVHPVHGPRMAPWCKLRAINDTMHRYHGRPHRVHGQRRLCQPAGSSLPGALLSQ